MFKFKRSIAAALAAMMLFVSVPAYAAGSDLMPADFGVASVESVVEENVTQDEPEIVIEEIESEAAVEAESELVEIIEEAETPEAIETEAETSAPVIEELSEIEVSDAETETGVEMQGVLGIEYYEPEYGSLKVIMSENEESSPSPYPITLTGGYAVQSCNYIVEDESILTVGYDADMQEVLLYPHKPGDTNLTISYGSQSITVPVKTFRYSPAWIVDNPGNITMYLGQSKTLKYEFAKPENNCYGYLYSMDESVCTVSQSGKITPKGVGTTEIYLESHVAQNDMVTITIKKPSMVAETTTMYTGHTQQLSVKGAASTLTWSSSDPDIAAVNSKGVIKGVREGKVTITAKSGTYKINKILTIKKPYLSASTASLTIPNSKTIKVYGNKGTVRWTSSNTSVATVASTGKVTAKNPGTATIKATFDGKYLCCKVTVKKPVLSATTASVVAKCSKTLKVTGYSGTIKWSSSNTTIATVSSTGKITGKVPGTCYIYATVNKTKLTCKVTVKQNIIKYSVSTSLSRYDYGEPQVRPTKIYYSGNDIIIEAYVFNNRRFSADYFDYITWYIRDNDGRSIATKKFYNVPLGMRPYSMRTLTFRIPAASVKKTNYNFTQDCDWEYDFWYSYTIM